MRIAVASLAREDNRGGPPDGGPRMTGAAEQ